MILTHGIVFCKFKGKKKKHSNLKYKIQILIINKGEVRTLQQFYTIYHQKYSKKWRNKKFKDKNAMHKQITHWNSIFNLKETIKL